MRSLFILVVTALLVSTALGDDTKETEEQYFKSLWDKGISQLSNGQLDEAVATLKVQVGLAPEHPGPLYNLACAYAKGGKSDDALSSLEHAVVLGWNRAEQTSEDSDLEPVQSDPRFNQLLQRMKTNQNRWLEQSQKAHRTIDPAETPSFGSLSELLEHFDAEEQSLAADAFRYSANRNTERRWHLLDQKVAALRRYMSEQPDPDCCEETAVAEIEALASYKEIDLSTHWDEDGPVVIEAADHFLGEFPGSDRKPDVLFIRAMATWLSRPKPAEAQEEGAVSFTDAHVGLLDSLLGELGLRYPSSAIAATVLVKRLELAELRYDGTTTPLQEELSAQLVSQYGDSTEIMRDAWQNVRRTMFHVHGFSGFQGTDLRGQRWDDAAMRGRVVLIDFWATWCGPCMREVPALKKAYAEFSDKGFEIVGVSLDRGDRATLEEKLTKLGITWPQIFDGKGRESSLARQFNVYSIPCMVILDREGTVAGVDFRGEALIERIAELVETR